MFNIIYHILKIFIYIFLQNSVEVFNNALIFKQKLPTKEIYGDIREY